MNRGKLRGVYLGCAVSIAVAKDAVCPECGQSVASARVPDDGFLSAWWLVPAAASSVLLMFALFIAATVGHNSIASAGQSSATWLLGPQQIAENRIDRAMTLGELRGIANGSIAPTFVPSDLRFRGYRRFRMDALEAPLMVTVTEKVNGAIGSEFQLGWPVAWLRWQSDRHSTDLQGSVPKPSAPATKPKVEIFRFFAAWSSSAPPEMTTSIQVLYLPFLVPPLFAFVLLAAICFAWKRIRGDAQLPISVLWLFLILASVSWFVPARSNEIVSAVAGTEYGVTGLTLSDIFAMPDSPEASKRIASEFVRALESSISRTKPSFNDGDVVGYGYSDYAMRSVDPRASSRPFDVDEYSLGVLDLFRVWRMHGKPETPPGRFVMRSPMGELYFRTQSPEAIRMAVVSINSGLYLLAMCFAPFIATRLWRMARADRLTRRHDASKCLHCGYDLRAPAVTAQ